MLIWTLLPSIICGGVAGWFIGQTYRYKGQYQREFDISRSLTAENEKLMRGLREYEEAFAEQLRQQQVSVLTGSGSAMIPDFSVDGQTGLVTYSTPHVIQEEI